MSKKHLAYLLATTLLAAPAIAQTSPSPSTSAPSSSTPSATDAQRGSAPSMNSGATGAQGSSMSGSTASSSSTGSAATSADLNKALAGPGLAQMMASDIRGTRVYGANSENVGDISDILLSRDGNVVALVVGVGGFLGIGQKDVAIPFKAFEFVTEGQADALRTSTSTATGTSPSAAGTAPRTTSNSASSMGSPTAPGGADAPNARGSTMGVPSVSGTTSSMSDANRSSTASSSTITGSTPSVTGSTTQTAGLLKPERIVLRGMTKADLEAAPQFAKTVASTPAPSR